ncbi:MAG: helix-turn-helix transcriptional regulator [Candidatus Thiodiazotropha sp.]
MNVSNKTLHMIARIYDVGLNSENWPVVLDELCNHMGAVGSALFYDDSNNPDLNADITAFSQFWSSCGLEKYQKHVQQYEPSEEIMRQARPGDVISAQLMPFTSELDIELYAKNMWEHFGICAVASVRMNDTGAWYDYLTFQFQSEHGVIQTDEVKELKILLPHITKAIEISRPTTLLKQRFKAVLDALDHFHIGVMIISDSGTVIINNIAAKKILEQKDGLVIDLEGRLRATEYNQQQLLQLSLCRVIETSRSNGTSSGEFINIERRSKRDAFLLDVVPIRDCDSQIGRGFHGAIVFCVDPTETRLISTLGIQNIYGLTKAESEVCRLLVNGLTYTQMAEKRNVSPETIKSQVQSALKKTRSVNRSELIRLALSINIPIDTPEV